MHSENLFFHQSVFFFSEVEFFSLWGCNVHCCSQLHKNPCLLVKQKNIDHIYILQAGVSLCIKGFISLFQLQAFNRKNEQNRGFFTVKFVMYRSNKIRAKKAFIFIEKYMHSNGAGRKEATEMRELCLQRCLILGILHQSKHYIVPMSYF